MELFANGNWLPLVFVVLMGVSILAYVVLDGYDLGVGMLMSRAKVEERDVMISSIGPFWDANETWLVLSVGLLLVAFPMAHGLILTALYLPTAVMLIGLILRGVAFDFRAKAKSRLKNRWDKTFIAGSFMASISQGYMLGMYIMGLENTWQNNLFSLLVGICLACGYCFIGANWLIMKTEHGLQKRSVKWARRFLGFTTVGLVLISIATPLVSHRIFEKWFTMPYILYLSPIPVIAGLLIVSLFLVLNRLPKENDKHCWVPFVGSILLFICGFIGLAYSFFPFIVPDKLTIWEAASAHESLMIILVGALVVLPAIIGYTIFAYKVFHGKVKELSYY
jgi:cytochrome d ubiquinol oxidase subunit II